MSSPKYIIAEQNDDTDINQFCQDYPSEGNIKISLDQSPSFFEAMEVEGTNSLTFIGRDEDRIVGTCNISEKPCYVNGKETHFGYLGGLRIHPDFQNTMMLHRGFKLFKKISPSLKAKVFSTNIASSNTQAINILTSKRGGLPNYEYFGKFNSLIFNLTSHKKLAGAYVISYTADSTPQILVRVPTFIHGRSQS